MRTNYLWSTVFLIFVGCSSSSRVGIVLTDDYAVDTLTFHSFEHIRISDSILAAKDSHAYQVSSVAPNYPELARRNGITGTVLLKALVDSKGDVVKAVVLKTDDAVFNRAALESLMQWKFNPAFLFGEPARWIEIPIHFAIRNHRL
jgi:TonB family protein